MNKCESGQKKVFSQEALTTQGHSASRTVPQVIIMNITILVLIILLTWFFFSQLFMIHSFSKRFLWQMPMLTFHRDVLTGPTERNPLVGILLERQARWCYKHRSNIIMMVVMMMMMMIILLERQGRWSNIISTALAVLFTLVDSGIDIV